MSSYCPNTTCVHAGCDVAGAVVGCVAGAAVVNDTVICGLSNCALPTSGESFATQSLARSPGTAPTRSVIVESSAGSFFGSTSCHEEPVLCSTSLGWPS